MRTDSERLDWLATQDGSGLISDDFGRWAVSSSGIQNIPDDINVPSDIQTTFFVEARDWRLSIREAVDAAMDGGA